jgi:hypothetical protein
MNDLPTEEYISSKAGSISANAASTLGFFNSLVDTLFLALSFAWKGPLAQYAGRIHRESDGKDRVTIYDYVDCSLPILQRMFNKQEKSYKTMRYQISLTCNFTIRNLGLIRAIAYSPTFKQLQTTLLPKQLNSYAIVQA